MNGLPNDRGPIYFETVMGRFPVEPWNTYSNLLFLALIIYWAWRLVREGAKSHRFIFCALPVLFIGWLGGTIYHATRSSNIWLILDFGPIAILVVAAAAYFWRRVGLAWLWVMVAVLGPIATVMGIISALDLPDAARPYVGYPMMAVSMLLPVLWNLRRENWADLPIVATALTLFTLAVTFRTLDSWTLREVFPMGTHWLWHTLGAGAVQLLILYIWRSDLRVSPPYAEDFPAEQGKGSRTPGWPDREGNGHAR